MECSDRDNKAKKKIKLKDHLLRRVVFSCKEGERFGSEKDRRTDHTGR